jgi:uncharacterized membrane protein YhaH (DUF805 family)
MRSPLSVISECRRRPARVGWRAAPEPRRRSRVHWYTDVLRRYTDFDGRSDRPEFWWFGLINLIVSLVLWAIGIAAFGFQGGQLVAVLYGLVTLLPALGVEIRRLHDTNRSGWWILIGLIPIIGGITLIVFFASAGTQGSNGFGLQPPPRVAA